MAQEGGADRVIAQKPKGKAARGPGARPNDPSDDSLDFARFQSTPLNRSKKALQMLESAQNPLRPLNADYSDPRPLGTTTYESTSSDAALEIPAPHQPQIQVSILPTPALLTPEVATIVSAEDQPVMDTPPEDNLVQAQNLEAPILGDSYNWDAVDLEIFQLLHQQVKRTRERMAAFLRTHEALGLQQTGSEALDLQLLIRRVSPELQRFIPRFYPNIDPLPEARSKPTPRQEAPLNVEHSTPSVGHQTPESPTTAQPSDSNPSSTVVANLSPQLLADLEATFACKAELMVIGYINGKCPGPRKLNAWASTWLHGSFVSMSMRPNNFFEVLFSQELGRAQTLTNINYTCDNLVISFAPWSPFFDAETETEWPDEKLKIALWVQIVGLPLPLQTKPFLIEALAIVGEVLLVDESEAYRAKMSRPRVRILTEDIDNLPRQKILFLASVAPTLSTTH